MTAFEFYDNTPIENVISILSYTPDKIYFLGSGEEMARIGTLCDDVFGFFGRNYAHGSNVFEIEPVEVDVNNIENVFLRLRQLVFSELENDRTCMFDVTGGREIMLLALGRLLPQISKNDMHLIRVVRLDISTGTYINVLDRGVSFPDHLPPTMDPKGFIKLQGGLIRYDDEEELRGNAHCRQSRFTHKWDVTVQLKEDVSRLWEISCKDPGEWNRRITAVGIMYTEFVPQNNDPLAVDASLNGMRILADSVVEDPTPLLTTLEREGFIGDLSVDGDRIRFRFRDENSMLLLTKAGTILEMKIYLLALEIKKPDGGPADSAFFNEAATGVYLDWDGRILDTPQTDTANEIDVFLMHGLQPLFISCKNGHIDDSEPYKLHSVATRFGGAYVKKCLIYSYAPRNVDEARKFRSVLSRLQDMGITPIGPLVSADGAVMPDDAIKNRLVQLAKEV